MKFLRFGLLSCACLLNGGSIYAQNISESSGAHGYVEDKNGNPSGGISIPEDRNGSVAGMSQKTTKWTKADAVAVHYFHHPAAEVETSMVLKVNAGKRVTFKVCVYDTQNLKEPIYSNNEITINGDGKEQEVTLVKYNFEKKGYYRYSIECISGCTDIIEISKFIHKSPSQEATYKSGYLSSPSVHLNNWASTKPGAPKGETYDWCYQEVMMPKESDISGTYVMSMGVMNGYMGIQMNGYENGKSRHDIIFSIWDKGNTDSDPNLPDNLRAKLVDKNELATNTRFGNEGTGMKSFMAGHFWECDKFVQFITNCRKEMATYVDKDGVEKTQENTLVSAWFNAQDGKGWQYISTLRMPAQHKRFDSWYSFLENYNWPTGQMQRKGYYRNGYGCDGNGNWFHFNKVGASHTDGELDPNGNEIVGKRYDYGYGVTEECVGPNGEKAFFMTTGGYGQAVKKALEVPLNTTNTAVDTINLDVLLKRVDQAIINEKIAKGKEGYWADSKLNKTGWTIQASSEETIGEQNGNGPANKLIDGDNNTYWHSKWLSGATGCPHTLVIDMQTAHDIAGMEILQSIRNDRLIKSFKLYGSLDQSSWKDIYVDDNVSLERDLRFVLPQSLNTRYLKLEILKTSNSEGHVNLFEINVLRNNPKAIEGLKQQMGAILENPNVRNVGYPSLSYLSELQHSYDDLCAQGNYGAYEKALSALVMYENGRDFILPEKNVLYTLATKNRGNWVALDDRFESTKNAQVNISADYKNEKQQFMFVEEAGKFYLYSPSLKKYLTKNDKVLSDRPQDAFTISKHEELGQVFMTFDTSHNINFGGDNQLVINGYSKFDEGNAFAVDAVGIMADLKPTTGAMKENNVATFSSPFAVTSEPNVKVYYVTNEGSNTSVKLVAVEEGGVIPANAGVLVAANDKQQTRLIKADVDAQPVELTGNVLQNTAVAPAQMKNGDYILLKPELKSLAFYKATVGSILPRYRAYLHMNSAAAAIHMDWDSNVTGLEEIENVEDTNAAIYDLSGRLISKVVKGGIYIQNGKKFIVK